MHLIQSYQKNLFPISKLHIGPVSWTDHTDVLHTEINTFDFDKVFTQCYNIADGTMLSAINSYATDGDCMLPTTCYCATSPSISSPACRSFVWNPVIAHHNLEAPIEKGHTMHMIRFI